MRVAGAQINGKVFLDEDPSAAHFCTRHRTSFGAAAQLFRVHFQKAGSFREIQCFHGSQLPF